MKLISRLLSTASIFTLLILTTGIVSGSDKKGQPVPLFSLTDQNGNLVSLEQQRGKVVMINFWATWCPPCVHELPTMIALKESFSDRPFEILAINTPTKGAHANHHTM